MTNEGSRFSRIPEISLTFISFFLNFFWEVAQTYFYTMKDSPFTTMLYGWIHCTLGDVILTVVSFWIVSIISRSRKWFLHLTPKNFISFIMIGVVATVISERVNVYVLNSWAYNERMLLVPLLKVGLTPFLQWMIIPPMVILMLKHYFYVAHKT